MLKQLVILSKVSNQYLQEMLVYFKKRLIDGVKHRHCFICQQSSITLICEYCVHDAALALFPAPGHNLLDSSQVYPNLSPPAYEGLYALAKYEGIVKGLVNKLKFSKQSLASEVLAEFFELYVLKVLRVKQGLPDIVVPIPLSPQRHVSREYNQASLIAKSLCKRSGIKCIDLLEKTRHTPQQSSLNRDDRLSNVQGAFKLRHTTSATSIAIVDDVMTTGTTCNEACKTILQAYPEMKIDVWCMAVSLPEQNT